MSCDADLLSLACVRSFSGYAFVAFFIFAFCRALARAHFFPGKSYGNPEATTFGARRDGDIEIAMAISIAVWFGLGIFL